MWESSSFSLSALWVDWSMGRRHVLMRLCLPFFHVWDICLQTGSPCSTTFSTVSDFFFTLRAAHFASFWTRLWISEPWMDLTV